MNFKRNRFKIRKKFNLGECVHLDEGICKCDGRNYRCIAYDDGTAETDRLKEYQRGQR